VIRPEVVDDCLYRFTVPAGSSTVPVETRGRATSAGLGSRSLAFCCAAPM
jgi:hypothetical protein